MNKIKVLYILPTEKKYSGDNISMLNLLIGLKNHNIVPLVLTTSIENATVFIKNDIDCEVLPYPFRFTILCPSYKTWKERLRFPYNLFLTYFGLFIANKALLKITNKFKPNIIHSNTSHTIIGYNISQKFNIPHIWHIREFIDLDFNSNLIITKNKHRFILNKKNNYLVFITNCIKRHYNSLPNSRVIYDGVANSNQFQFEKNKNKTFLFVGRITEMKGIFLLLNAFFEFCLLNTEYNLLLAGEKMHDLEFEKIKELVNRKGLSNRIIFLGNRDDIYNLMSVTSALIVPSLNEAFGRITVEAMFSGCLVVGYNSSGTNEILANDNLGLLFTSQDELTKILLNIASSDIDVFFPRIKKAQLFAFKNFTIEHHSNLIYEYYNQILI
jgi:glycosyltransferase involved in cell wall biosynthesis